jgi:hypothetical protein
MTAWQPAVQLYLGVSKSFRTGRPERELQMAQLSATTCSCIAILWVSLVSFAAITICVASQRVFIVVSVYFVIDSVRKLLDTPMYMLPNCVLINTSKINNVRIRRWVVSFSLRPLYSPGKSPRHPPDTSAWFLGYKLTTLFSLNYSEHATSNENERRWMVNCGFGDWRTWPVTSHCPAIAKGNHEMFQCGQSVNGQRFAAVTATLTCSIPLVKQTGWGPVPIWPRWRRETRRAGNLRRRGRRCWIILKWFSEKYDTSQITQ